jgi:hypothetical protein
MRKNLLGDKYGNLTVIKREGRNVVCLCDCGTITKPRASNITCGKTRSCGCMKPGPKPNPAAHTRKPEYWIWCDVRRRCYDPKRENYSAYGGRGIRVCDRWLSGENRKTGFECFYEDMGPRPNNQTLDRIDTNGHYIKSNCRWATWKTQGRNRRTTKMVTYGGSTMPLAELCERLGRDHHNVNQRLRLGWTIEQAIELPPYSKPLKR